MAEGRARCAGPWPYGTSTLAPMSGTRSRTWTGRIPTSIRSATSRPSRSRWDGTRAARQEATMQVTRNSIETVRGRANGSPARSTSTRSLRRRTAHASSRARPLHPRRAHGLAHPPERPDDLGHGGDRPRAAARRADRGDPPGDRVFFEPGEEHWHGAAPNRFMTHLAMLEVGDDGTPSDLGRPRHRRRVRGGPVGGGLSHARNDQGDGRALSRARRRRVRAAGPSRGRPTAPRSHAGNA